MVADESFDEKSEPASPRRIERARAEGRVLRSQDVTSAAMLAGSIVVLVMWIPFALDAFSGLTRSLHGHAGDFDLDASHIPALFGDAVRWGAGVLGPVCISLAFVAIAINLIQVGPLIAPAALTPKFDKLDPIQGMKRLVSIQSGVELLKSMAKIVIVAAVAVMTIGASRAELLSLDHISVQEAAAVWGAAALRLLVNVSAAFIVIAALDYAFQRWHYLRGLRMSKREVQDEHKESDGDPFIKGRVRGLMREMSRRRMLDDVADATVVITNPVRVAVALRYQPGRDGAPIVVAKGMRRMAALIRERAGEHKVPIVENPPLARQLHRSVRVGSVVPTALYRAVAEVLAFVYQMRTDRGRPRERV